MFSHNPSGPARRHRGKVWHWMRLTGLVCGVLWAVADTGFACQALSGQSQDVESQRRDFTLQPETVEAAPVDPVFTIQQAIELAVANDPGFRQIHWMIEKAKGQRYQATRLPNPTTGVVANEVGNEGAAGQYGVFWSQNIVRNNRQGIQCRYFSLEIARLQTRYDVRRWQLTRSIANRFLAVCRFNQELAAINGQVLSLQNMLELIRKRFEAGEVSRLAVSNIELELDALRQRAVEKRLSSEFERRALAVPLGLAGADAGGQIAGLPRTDFGWEPMVDGLLERQQIELDTGWLDQHPQAGLAQARVQQARWQIELARSQRCPDVQVQGSLNYDDATDDLFAGFQVGVPLLRNDDKSGAIRAATAESARLQEEVRRVEMRLQSAWMIALGEFTRMQSRVRNIREVIIPRAEHNRDQIRVAFEAGEAEFLLLKSGFERVLQARLDLVAAEYEMALAETRLQTLLIEE